MTIYAELKENEVEGLKECEDDMGVILVAYERPVTAAHINESKLGKIKVLEKEIGVKLVAYE